MVFDLVLDVISDSIDFFILYDLCLFDVPVQEVDLLL